MIRKIVEGGGGWALLGQLPVEYCSLIQRGVSRHPNVITTKNCFSGLMISFIHFVSAHVLPFKRHRLPVSMSAIALLGTFVSSYFLAKISAANRAVRVERDVGILRKSSGGVVK